MKPNWNLPPGVTASDIDAAVGGPRADSEMKECPDCEGSGKLLNYTGPNPALDERTCEKCKGEGEIEMTYEEAAEQAADARAEKADRQRDDDIDRQMGL